MKQKILIISGGISKERTISLETGKQVAKELKKNNFIIKITEPNHNLDLNIRKFKPDIIFNALHGQFGEDGFIQSILEGYKIPYTHSGVIASALAMNKEISKKIFLKHKILTPKYIKYSMINKKLNIIELVKKKLNFPVVVKPISEGSSVDVYICNKKNLISKIKKLKSYREIQVAIMGKKKLGAIELKPKRKFYDYQAKYNPKAKTRHIIPVNLSPKDLNKVLNLALKAHRVIGCRGITRSDFKFYKGKFYLLEINTQPGMTKLSLVPEIALYEKISFLNLIKWIIKDASFKK